MEPKLTAGEIYWKLQELLDRRVKTEQDKQSFTYWLKRYNKTISASANMAKDMYSLMAYAFNFGRAERELQRFLGPAVDQSHGITHAKAVLDHATCALKLQQLNEKKVRNIQLAAYLHDADDNKYFPDHHNYENGRKILKELDIEEESIAEIIYCISLVSCSTNGNSVVEDEYDLYPRYADRLESIGEIGIARCYLYSKHVNRPLFTVDTPRPTNLNSLYQIATKERFDDYVNKRGKVGQSTFIDHFYDKLLHLTDFGTNAYFVEEGKMRLKIMENYVLDFGRTGKIDEDYLIDLVKKYGLNN